MGLRGRNDKREGRHLPSVSVLKRRGGWKRKARWAIFAVCMAGLPFSTFAETIESERGGWQADKRNQLDWDILLLKAQLAREKGAIKEVESLLSQMDVSSLSPENLKKFQALQQYLKQKQKTKQEAKSMQAEISQSQHLPLFYVETSHTMILLPLSGRYGKVGQAILAGIRSQGKEDFSQAQVVDTALFDSPEEVWSLVRRFEPSLIIGPLRPSWVEALSTLDQKSLPATPMLVLNDLENPPPMIRILAPRRETRLKVLALFLHSLSVQRLLVLKAAKEASYLMAYLSNKPLFQRGGVKIESFQEVHKTMDLAIEKGLNAKHSLRRIHWLRHTLQRPLAFEVRARQDIQAAVFVGDVSKAIQGRPLLNFYHQNRVPFIWFPASLPDVQIFESKKQFWQQTYAILPAFFPLQASVKEHQRQGGDKETVKTGMFNALGETAVQLLEKVAENKPEITTVFQTKMGWVWKQPEGHFSLLPHVVWLDEGAVDELNLLSILGREERENNE